MITIALSLNDINDSHITAEKVSIFSKMKTDHKRSHNRTVQ